MNTAAGNDPRIVEVRITPDQIVATLADGRVIYLRATGLVVATRKRLGITAGEFPDSLVGSGSSLARH